MAISKEEIERINELSRKSKTDQGLTEDERSEQKDLRRKYIDSVKSTLRDHLDNIDIKNEDGSITHLGKKADNGR